jgi:hypothetical protein
MRAVLVTTISVVCFSLVGCEEPGAQSNRSQQTNKAAQAAQSVRFDENAEIDNIKKRLELTGDPGKLGFILLLNQAGQPILYEGVRGKITSGGKRLTPPDRDTGTYDHPAVRQAPSDEGTWGSASPYIYYWNVEGVYRQWAGDYLYSDQPIRLKVEPLVVTVTAGK